MSEEEKSLLAAGWTKSEYDQYIRPLGVNRPRKQRYSEDEDDPCSFAIYDTVETSDFLIVDYSLDFEYLDEDGNDDVPILKLGALHRRKKLTKATSSIIGKIVFNNTRLDFLDIEMSGDKEIDIAFFEHWHGKDCRLLCLNLEYNYTCFGGSDDSLTKVFGRLLKNNNQLVELCLRNTKLTVGNARELADILSSGPNTLKHLSLRNNDIDDEGVKAISESVRDMPNIESIELWGNNVTKFQSISSMLYAPKLCEIDLRFCLGRRDKTNKLDLQKILDEFTASLKRETNLWTLTDWNGSLKLKKQKGNEQTGKRKR